MFKKSRFKSLSAFFIVLAVILLLIFFSYRGWLTAPSDIIDGIFSPFLKFFNWSGNKISSAMNIYFTLKDLKKSNEQLRRQNLFLWQESSALKEAARENEILRQRLELDLKPGQSLVLARVIGYSAQSGQYFLIDKGSADGLIDNLAAVTANNFLVGRLAQTRSYSSKIVLLPSGESSVNALTQDSRISGIVKGSHGLGLQMDMLPIDKKINEGEVILTSGSEDGVPAGLIIGWVREIILKEADLFQRAKIEPAADFNNLEQIFILK